MRSLLSLLLLASACGTPTLVETDYAKNCSVDADCVAVYIGPLCQVCGGCANTAINVADKAKRDADAASAARSCPPRFGPQPACAPCRQPAAACTSGTCVLKELP
ncbi:MAG: hypothetical protein JNJ54_31760 [Myxococcaceae bacterium]|nr:hypothetical protein [Myxococcaceae bacterium]